MSGHARRPIDLSIGNPGYGPPLEVQAAAVQAVGRGLGGYAPAGGLRGLRARLAERLRAHNGIDAHPDQVIVTSGASLGIFATLSGLCRPGDLLLLPDPCFPLYRIAAETIGLRVTTYSVSDPEREYAPDWEALGQVAHGARVLVWNYPSNPTGALAGPAWFDHLSAVLHRFPGLILLSDEVYEDLCLDGRHTSAAAAVGGLADRVVSVFSFSKSYGMAAWRVGYLHARSEWAARIARAQWGAAMSTSTLGQLAGLAALAVPPSYLDERRAFLRANRDLAVSRLRACGLPCEVPAGGFFAWADMRRYGGAAGDFADRCGAETGVLISDGADFGPAGRYRVRLNYAVPSQWLAEALDRLHEWTASLDSERPAGSQPRPATQSA
jgi:aspartate/methionine/tyrosine aminotransferase